jgi:hypothetical protein
VAFDWEPTKKYLRGADGDVWRALSLGWSTFAHERWDPTASIWRLELETPDGLTEVAEEDAETVIGAALAEPGEATHPVVGLPGPDKLGSRGEWLCDRIDETLDFLGDELSGAIGEVSVAQYGSDDYAYEMDVLIEVKAAYPTLRALWRELREIQRVRVRIIRDAVEQGHRPPPEPGEYWP